MAFNFDSYLIVHNLANFSRYEPTHDTNVEGSDGVQLFHKLNI